MNAVVERQVTPVTEARMQLEQMQGQFAAALPAHIPVERFARVVMTAIQNQPALLDCSRRSLWNSAMKAAQDGLLPDGREGAIVKYGSDAQWMPMIAGLRKKVRNSGEIATWDAQVVHEKDKFKFQLGDDPFIHHEPCLDGEPGPVIAAYSIAVLKSGEKAREVMTVSQIEKVRSRSKASKNGPWVTDYEEMCRKTVARRHSKTLPMSTDLDDLLRRDDDLYDMQGAREQAVENNGGRPQTIAGKLDVLAQLPSGATAQAEAGTAQAGVETETTTNQNSSQNSAPVETAADQAASDQPQPGSQSSAAPSGAADVSEWPKGKIPANAAEYGQFARTWFARVKSGAMSIEDAQAQWKGERPSRNKLHVASDVTEGLHDELQKIIADVKAKVVERTV